jgi:hypothetical protein
MPTHIIEPGQRLRMLVGGISTTVSVISEAIVPAGYWICRDESCGQQRVIAHTVLEPLPDAPSISAVAEGAIVLPLVSAPVPATVA